MRALPKNHIYNLFFEKESQYLMVFRNNRTYSIMLGLTLCGLIWGFYLLIIFPLPDTVIYKSALSSGFLLMGGVALLALFSFLGAHETLTLRQINRSMIYECHSVGGSKGWKKRFEDFQILLIYKDLEFDMLGRRLNKKSIWHFELIGKDEITRIPLHPSSLKPFYAWQEDEALAFAQKIAHFMGIPLEKAHQQEIVTEIHDQTS